MVRAWEKPKQVFPGGAKGSESPAMLNQQSAPETRLVAMGDRTTKGKKIQKGGQSIQDRFARESYTVRGESTAPPIEYFPWRAEQNLVLLGLTVTANLGAVACIFLTWEQPLRQRSAPKRSQNRGA